MSKCALTVHCCTVFYVTTNTFGYVMLCINSLSISGLTKSFFCHSHLSPVTSHWVELELSCGFVLFCSPVAHCFVCEWKWKKLVVIKNCVNWKKKGWKWLSHEEWTDKLSSDLIDVTLIWSVMFIIRPMLHSSFTTQKVIYHYRKVSSRGKVTQNNWQKWKWWKCLWIHSESDKNICELRSRPCKL